MGNIFLGERDQGEEAEGTVFPPYSSSPSCAANCGAAVSSSRPLITTSTTTATTATTVATDGANNRATQATVANATTKECGPIVQQLSNGLNSGPDQANVEQPPLSRTSTNLVKKPEAATVLPSFPSVWRLPPEDAKIATAEIVEVFDEAYHVICKVIASDIFPRFKKCDKYLTVKNDEAYQARLV
jgi:hypothetical protein